LSSGDEIVLHDHRSCLGWDGDYTEEQGYLIGLLAIGIADLAFLFAMVLAGVIEFNAGTVGGPVLWFLAVLITPFGLPAWRRADQGTP
jgi:hypothetical protein